MLGANTHELSHIIHIIKEVSAKHFSTSMRIFNQPSKHRYSGGLTCSIVTKESEYLATVHLEVDTFDSFKTIWVNFF